MEQHHRGDGDHLILSSFDERFCAAQPIELFIFQGTRAHTPRYVLGGAHCHVGARFACAITSLVQQVLHDAKSTTLRSRRNKRFRSSLLPVGEAIVHNTAGVCQ